jgi:hypothetical protein
MFSNRTNDFPMFLCNYGVNLIQKPPAVWLRMLALVVLAPEVFADLRLQFAGELVVEKTERRSGSGCQNSRGIGKIGAGEDGSLPFLFGQLADKQGYPAVLNLPRAFRHDEKDEDHGDQTP